MIEESFLKCLEQNVCHPLCKGPCVCSLKHPFSTQTLDSSSLDFTFYSHKAFLSAQTEILGSAQIPAVLCIHKALYMFIAFQILGNISEFFKAYFSF